MFTQREIAAFSLHRAIEAAATGSLRGTLEAELLGASATPMSFRLPFELLSAGRRDLVTAPGSAGGYLVSTTTGNQPIDVLRPYSAALGFGARLLPGQTGSLGVPVVTAASPAHWLAHESDPLPTDEQPALGKVASSPRTVAALVRYSRQLRLQANPDQFLARHLLGTIGAALDSAILQGAGAAGEPLGLLSLPGVADVAGTDFAWDSVLEMEEAASAADAEPTGLIGTPAVRRLLKKRPRITDGEVMIWDGAAIAGIPAAVTTTCPTGTLFAGRWDEVVVPVWGEGIEIAFDPATAFRQGVIQARAMLSCDVAIAHPAAFARATSIT